MNGGGVRPPLEDRRARIARAEVIDHRMAAILRAKSPAEKLAILDGMIRFARLQIAAGVRLMHPDWNEEQVRREVARRFAVDGD